MVICVMCQLTTLVYNGKNKKLFRKVCVFSQKNGIFANLNQNT